MRLSLFFTLTIAFLFSPATGSWVRAEDEGADFEFFEKNIRPVLMEVCFECHGKGLHTKGNLRFSSRSDLLKGGDRGPTLKPGDPDGSLLIQAIRRTHPDIQMPPKKPLEPRQIADFETWVRRGAAWPQDPASAQPRQPGEDHWAFKQLSHSKPPAVKNSGWVRNDIDRFILSRLEQEGLKPAPATDRRTLIRRVTYDLTGLPPTPEEVDAFVHDASPTAYEKVVDRLLASPHYGERWGRHWLDLARYADTSGDGTDMPIPEAYLYRNYVIAAFNRDMPFDQFLTEQIAGDILAAGNSENPRYAELITATGFVALSRRFGNSRYADMHLVIDNTLDTIGKSVMGMSLSCARCHDHKFDPISREDYYGLYGYFQSTRYPHAGSEHGKQRENFVPLKPGMSGSEKLDPLAAEINDLEQKQKNLRKQADKKQEADNLGPVIQKKKDELQALRHAIPVAWAVTDKPAREISEARIQIAGEPSRLGDAAPRGYLDILDSSNPALTPDSSGRLELVRWLTQKNHPLTTRVMANRIWLYHFGSGIVPTPSTFGTQGQPPSHPQLLDWLALKFSADGFSFKKMNRLMVLSATYQMSSQADDRALAKDPTNRLLWRFPRQRLDAESIRDTLLTISGQLNTHTGQAHPFPPIEKLNYTQHRPFSDDYDHNQRSVYLMQRRLGRHSFFKLFDGPDTNLSTPQRSVSTVPLQALYLMNSPFVHEQAGHLAKRLIREKTDEMQRIQRLYALAYARPAGPDEIAGAQAYLKDTADRLSSISSPKERSELAWTSLSRSILISNEMFYID